MLLNTYVQVQKQSGQPRSDLITLFQCELVAHERVCGTVATLMTDNACGETGCVIPGGLCDLRRAEQSRGSVSYRMGHSK